MFDIFVRLLRLEGVGMFGRLLVREVLFKPEKESRRDEGFIVLMLFIIYF